MKQPFRVGSGFLSDVASVRRRPATLDIWWLGQSGFLIHHRETFVLVDPYLSDTLTDKYAETDKPHVRMTARVVDPAELARELGFIYLITSSHGHTDHLDPGTLRPVLSAASGVGTVICPKPQLQMTYERSAPSTVAGKSPHFVGLDDGESWGEGVKVTAIPAAHNTIDRDEGGHCKYLGYVFQFSPMFVSPRGSIYKCEKEWTVYHSGDTLLYPGLVERLRPFNIDVALLPINGNRAERRVAGNLNGREAAQLAKDIGAKIVIPCHYDMFEFNTADPAEEFIPECERIGQAHRVLQQGERFSSSEIPR